MIVNAGTVTRRIGKEIKGEEETMVKNTNDLLLIRGKKLSVMCGGNDGISLYSRLVRLLLYLPSLDHKMHHNQQHQSDYWEIS